MHFFYIDETGCTGADLNSAEQPIFVIGGISVTDEAWRKTNANFRHLIVKFFDGTIPAGFELHATDLINGEGAFAGCSRRERNALVYSILDVIAERKHAIHFIGLDKQKLAAAPAGQHPIIDCKIPYLIGFNYLVTYIERFVKRARGKSARGMIILDKKEMYQEYIDRLTYYRRYDVPNVRRLKWTVEFSYPVDSVRHPMVQVSDLVIFLVRKFLECENEYRSDWSDEAKNFFASCYDKIIKRVKWNTLITVDGSEEEGAFADLTACHATHRRLWRNHYTL